MIRARKRAKRAEGSPTIALTQRAPAGGPAEEEGFVPEAPTKLERRQPDYRPPTQASPWARGGGGVIRARKRAKRAEGSPNPRYPCEYARFQNIGRSDPRRPTRDTRRHLERSRTWSWFTRGYRGWSRVS